MRWKMLWRERLRSDKLFFDLPVVVILRRFATQDERDFSEKFKEKPFVLSSEAYRRITSRRKI
jgi:hypothetical protein